MIEELTSKKFYDEQIQALKNQEKYMEKRLIEAKDNLDKKVEEQIFELQKKQKNYEKQIMLAQMKGSDSIMDAKPRLDKLWADIEEEYRKLKMI